MVSNIAPLTPVTAGQLLDRLLYQACSTASLIIAVCKLAHRLFCDISTAMMPFGSFGPTIRMLA